MGKIYFLVIAFLLLVPGFVQAQPRLLDLTQKKHEAEVSQKPQEPVVKQEKHEGEVSQKPHDSVLTQKKHEEEISRRPHDLTPVLPTELEKKRPAPRKPGEIFRLSPPTLKDKLSQAWRHYRKGKYARAIPLFAEASTSRHPPTAQEAKLGLAYSYLKGDQRDKAGQLLEELVKKGYKLKETLPNLLSLLILEEDYARAKTYLPLLPQDQRRRWEKKIQESGIRQGYQRLARPVKAGELNRFVARHEEGLESCAAPDVFARVAKELADAGEKSDAASLYRKLLQCPEEDWKLRLGIFYGLADTISPEELESLLREEKGKGPQDYRNGLVALDLSLLRKQLQGLPAASPEVEGVARRILTLRPDDPSAQRALAWAYYNQGKYEDAYRLFSSLHARYPGERDYALGLAYTQLRMGKMDEALALAERVGFRDGEWQRIRSQLYLAKAREAYEKKDFPVAESYLRKSLANQPENRDAQLLLGWVQFSRGRYEDALSLVREEREKGRDSPEYLARLDALELAVLRKQLEALPPSSPEVERIARRILALQPGDPAARRALAWMYYNQGKDAEAYRLFSSLHGQDPGERDYALGLIYTQMRLGKTDEALALAESAGFRDEEWQRIRNQLYLREAKGAYEKKEYARAESYVGNSLAVQPDDREAKILSGRIHAAQGRPQEALPVFLEEYEKFPSPELGESILSLYDQTGERKKAFQFADSLGKEASPSSKKVAADFFYKQGAPVWAAQTYAESWASCYYNADKPSLDFSLLYRSKSGTKGFDRLNELNLPITLDNPARWGKKWTFSLLPTYLNSGSAESNPRAGSYYRYLNGEPKRNDLVESLWLVKPELGFQQEGPILYGFLLGTSFIGGPVSPLPAFTAGLKGKNWLVQAHQLQVDESILSYAGQKDPYSDRKWGRVLRTGVEGEINFEPLPYTWLSLSAGYDYLWGEEVWSNHTLWGNASFGKTLNLYPGDLSLGWFATVKHFERNTSFFTFGHGGYFSPKIFFMSGPTVRFRTTPCATFSFDGSISGGYLYYRTEDSPHYPLFSDDLSRLNESAGNDARAKYTGEDASKLGVSGKVRIVKLLGRHWIGSAFVGFNNAADYNEWRAGVSLQYFFDSIGNGGEFRHFLLREPEDRFQRFSR